MNNPDLREEIELGWDGPDSSMTMDEIIEAKEKSKCKDSGISKAVPCRLKRD